MKKEQTHKGRNTAVAILLLLALLGGTAALSGRNAGRTVAVEPSATPMAAVLSAETVRPEAAAPSVRPSEAPAATAAALPVESAAPKALPLSQPVRREAAPAVTAAPAEASQAAVEPENTVEPEMELTVDDTLVPLAALPQNDIPAPELPVRELPTPPAAPSARPETGRNDSSDRDDSGSTPPVVSSTPAPSESAEVSPVPTPSESAEVSPSPVPTEPVEEDTRTNLQKTVDFAQAIVDGYNACEDDNARREYLGVTNSNFSNDTFRALMADRMDDTALELDDETVLAAAAQAAASDTQYIHAYFLKNTAGAASPMDFVIYTTSNQSISGGSKWAAWLVWLPQAETYEDGWFITTQTHSHTGALQTNTVSGFRNASADVMAEEVLTSDNAWAPLFGQPAPEYPDYTDEAAIQWLLAQLDDTESKVYEFYHRDSVYTAALNSTGVNFGESVNTALRAFFGLDEDASFTWRVYRAKNGSELNVFFTRSVIEDEDTVLENVTAHFSKAPGEYLQGTASVIYDDDNNLVLYGNSFTAYGAEPMVMTAELLPIPQEPPVLVEEEVPAQTETLPEDQDTEEETPAEEEPAEESPVEEEPAAGTEDEIIPDEDEDLTEDSEEAEIPEAGVSETETPETDTVEAPETGAAESTDGTVENTEAPTVDTETVEEI